MVCFAHLGCTHQLYARKGNGGFSQPQLASEDLVADEG